MSLPLDIIQIDKSINDNWNEILEDIQSWDKEKMDSMRKIQDTIQRMVVAKSQYSNVHIVLGQHEQQIVWQMMNKYDKWLINNQ